MRTLPDASARTRQTDTRPRLPSAWLRRRASHSVEDSAMRNFLAFLAAALLTFLGIGWYLGWYKIDRQPSTPGHSHISVDIDQDKIGKDVKTGADKIKDVIDKNAPDPNAIKDKSQSSTVNPAAPFKPADTPEAKKKIADGVVDLIADGWFSPDKK
jgi:hypothetical protein